MRVAKFIEKPEMLVIGIIENMSGMICPIADRSPISLAGVAEKKLLKISVFPIVGQFLLTPKW